MLASRIREIWQSCLNCNNGRGLGCCLYPDPGSLVGLAKRNPTACDARALSVWGAQRLIRSMDLQSGQQPVPNTGTPRVRPPTGKALPKWGLAIGASRTSNTGCQMSSSARVPAGPNRGHSVAKLALVRRMALNLPRHNGPPRDSLHHRQLRVTLGEDYRLHLPFGAPSPTTP